MSDPRCPAALYPLPAEKQVIDSDFIVTSRDTNVDAWMQHCSIACSMLQSGHILRRHVMLLALLCRCEKVIYSKKYGVDQICFTHHATSVVYSSKNGWDGVQRLGWDGKGWDGMERNKMRCDGLGTKN